ncbi:MAG TPA: fatty acid desaturase [Chlorobiota bacterium]|nr:fatty acid desaturase [Chlorobiota bacterium]
MISAIIIITLWSGLLTFTLTTGPLHPLLTPLLVMIQGFLYTGLFITAHDAMHGTVSRSARTNRIVGTLCALLFAGLSYSRLYTNHHRHHTTPAHDTDDPDYHPSGRLIPWFTAFMVRYATISQLLGMAVAYNIFAHVFHIPKWVLLTYWILPAFLGTFQLFYVGTYLPHRKPHTADMRHNARSMPKHHVLAFLACYFFGYHAEHHERPGIPWYRLWKYR